MFEPLPDDEQIEPQPEPSIFTGPKAMLAVVVLSVFGFGSYAIHEHNLASDLARQNATIQASMKMTNIQLDQLTAKLNELTAPKPAPVVEPVAASPVRHKHTARPRKVVHRVRREDPRFNKLQSQLDEQGRAIASTQQNLDSTRTELQGSIARTHNELVVLQKKGERRYFEFDVQKSRHFNPAGTMNIKLRKANVKHQYADLDLLVDDRVVTKKHVNLYEPAQFYTGDTDQAILVVINSITKNHIHGYVSEPKYLKSELAAMQQDADSNGASATSASSTTRQRLPVDGK